MNLRGQLGDEPLERELLFERGAVRAVARRRRSLMSTMDASTKRPFGVGTRVQAEFNGELRTVLAPAES